MNLTLIRELLLNKKYTDLKNELLKGILLILPNSLQRWMKKVPCLCSGFYPRVSLPMFLRTFLL